MNAKCFINTPLQRGDQTNNVDKNRFNGFSYGPETVQTVSPASWALDAWLKLGVNEMLLRTDSTT
jgi:hypothetical protein